MAKFRIRVKIDRFAATLAIAAALPGAWVTSAALGAGHNTKHKPKPDLVVSKLSNPPPSLGKSLAATARINNVGKAHAGASKTRFYLSTDTKLSKRDVLVGSGKAGALDPGKHEPGNASLTLPRGTKPGTYFLIACADGTHVVNEQNEANNCRASKKPGKLRCTIGDADCDGYLPPADCNDHNAAIHPGAPDKPDLKFIDSNCDGIDGNAQRAVFVSGIGDDAAPGTRAHPKRTLAAAVAAAAAQGKDVYATLGIYTERLYVVNGVGVYGGYDTSWKRSLSNQTRITGSPNGVGDTEAAVASNVTAPTKLQLLTLSPSAPSQFTSGASSYGLHGVDSGGLRIERVTVHAAAGVAGVAGGIGIPGKKGGDGKSGQSSIDDHSGGSGGVSAANHPGGSGGLGRVQQQWSRWGARVSALCRRLRSLGWSAWHRRRRRRVHGYGWGKRLCG